jgi:excisionase family DNA binding protein
MSMNSRVHSPERRTTFAEGGGRPRRGWTWNRIRRGEPPADPPTLTMVSTELLTVSKAALSLGVNAWTIRRWIAQGYLEASQPAGRGGRILIRTDAVEKLLDEAKPQVAA